MPEEPTSAAILVSVDLRQTRNMVNDHTCDPGGYAKCTRNMEHHRTCDSGGYEKCARNMEHHRTCDSGGYEKCARNMEHHRTCDAEGYETCYPERGYEYVHVGLARRAACISLSAEKTSQTEHVSHVNPSDEISTCAAKREESANTYIYSTPDVTKKVSAIYYSHTNNQLRFKDGSRMNTLVRRLNVRYHIEMSIEIPFNPPACVFHICHLWDMDMHTCSDH